MKRKIFAVAAALAVMAVYAHASSQPLCQMTLSVNPDGGASYQGATAGLSNSCAPANQDGGYGLSAAICKGIGPRMTLSFQSTASGSLQLGDAGTAASASKSLHMSAQSSSPSVQQLNGQVQQTLGAGEVCISFLVDNYDGGTQTLKVFTETSAPSFTDNGFNPTSR